MNKESVKFIEIPNKNGGQIVNVDKITNINCKKDELIFVIYTNPISVTVECSNEKSYDYFLNKIKNVLNIKSINEL